MIAFHTTATMPPPAGTNRLQPIGTKKVDKSANRSSTMTMTSSHTTAIMPPPTGKDSQ